MRIALFAQEIGVDMFLQPERMSVEPKVSLLCLQALVLGQ